VITLDAFAQARCLAPDWLVIDVEGFEIAVLRGAHELIRSRGNALGIIVEMHPSSWPAAGTTRLLAQATLQELGLCAIPLTGQTDPLMDYGHVYLAPR
jgi:hypothetical protein